MKPVVFFLVLLFPLAVRAQEQAKPFGQGTHALRGIIRSPKPIPGYEKKFELEPIRDYGQINPNTTVIILGDAQQPLNNLWFRTTGLDRFVKAGGALLVASDQAVGGPLSADFGVEIAGGFLQSDQADHFAGLPDCPLVKDRVANHPLFRRVDAIATNRPSALTSRASNTLQTFAWLPARLGPRRPTTRVPFMAGGELGQGRVLVMADHSVFINDMMLQPDTDNFDFAYNCIDWLTESGRRKQIMLVEDGEIVTNFNVSFKPPPLPKLPSQEQIVGRVNDLIAEAESKDQFNQLLMGLFGGWQQPRERAQALAHQRILRLLLLLATAGLAIFALLRLTASRHRADKLVPLLAGATALAVPARPILDLRQQALAESGNCAELARHLARRCLESGGCTQWDARPSVAVQGNLLRRWRVHGQVRWLWRLATATPRVSPRQLAEITELTAKIQDGLASGSIRLTETRN